MKKKPFVVIAYKNFGAMCGFSHIGLGVSAINISKYLVSNGIRSEVWPVLTPEDLQKKIDNCPAVTHVVIGAVWIPTQKLAYLCRAHPQVSFAVNCHSNLGFLQAEPNAIKLMREALDLEQGTHNFHTAGNSHRFCDWVKDAYNLPCTNLPNLYYLDHHAKSHAPAWDGGKLRMGIFGATRVYKNFSSAVAAAIEIAHQTKAMTEIWMNSGRDDGAGNVVKKAAIELTNNVPGVELKFFHWGNWPEFRRFIRTMHLMLQPSYTETFNMVTADGVAEGVPSVVSHAIEWAPHHWKADVDDQIAIAQVGRRLLHDPHAARDGLRALHSHNEKSFHLWKNYIKETMLP